MGRKRKLVEETNLALLEVRGGDPMEECFQVNSNTLEFEIVKVGKGNRRDGRMRELPFYATVRNRDSKVNNKRL